MEKNNVVSFPQPKEESNQIIPMLATLLEHKASELKLLSPEHFEGTDGLILYTEASDVLEAIGAIGVDDSDALSEIADNTTCEVLVEIIERKLFNFDKLSKNKGEQ